MTEKARTDEDTEPDYLHMMHKVSKQLPEPADWMSAVHVMADVLEELEDVITEEQKALLVGLGAMMYRQGFEEFKAGIGARDVMQKLMKGGSGNE